MLNSNNLSILLYILASTVDYLPYVDTQDDDTQEMSVLVTIGVIKVPVFTLQPNDSCVNIDRKGPLALHSTQC